MVLEPNSMVDKLRWALLGSAAVKEIGCEIREAGCEQPSLSDRLEYTGYAIYMHDMW